MTGGLGEEDDGVTEKNANVKIEPRTRWWTRGNSESSARY